MIQRTTLFVGPGLSHKQRHRRCVISCSRESVEAEQRRTDSIEQLTLAYVLANNT